jgi:outer membrane protein assembly factor BamE (lipoprotein component of BamABCDE complex)
MSRSCVAFLFAAFLASGCVSVRSSHGYILERGEEEVNARVGIDTKESVLAKYGEPSIIGAFDQNAWYYLASGDQSRAFFRPRVTAREIVAFHFDEAGAVQSVEKFGLEDGMNVKMASRVTRTRGKELSFWEQVLGNIGQLPAGGIGQQETPSGPR